MICIAIAIGVVWLWKGNSSSAKVSADIPGNASTVSTQAQDVVAAPEPAPEPPKPSIPQDLNEAIGTFKRGMSDETDALSSGAKALAQWAIAGLKWSELKALPQTSRARVMKDADTERGKGICLSGSIIEITADKGAGEKVYIGGLSDERGGIYRFVNVGSSGDIVEQSHARMCGVVIGRIDYSNSMGGMAHAVQLVGMFDLPENKIRKAPSGTSL
jgi:hypothetical protein